MREFLKICYAWSVKFMQSCISVISVCLLSSLRVARRLKHVEVGELSAKAFVLANGSSLKEILENEQLGKEICENDSIVMNYFAISDYFTLVRPKFYVLMDPVFFEEKNIQDNIKVKQMFEALNKLDWDMKLYIVNTPSAKKARKYITNDYVEIVLFNGTRARGGIRLQNFFYRHNLGIPSSRNVIIPAMMILINAGYKKIYLYGAEFSWTKSIDVNPQNNKVFLNDGHFYQSQDVVYYEKGWYKWYLENIVEMLDGVYQVAEYAKAMHVVVINRTKSSFIDAFPYENPDNIMQKS